MCRAAAEQAQRSIFSPAKRRDKLASSAVADRFAVGGIKRFAIGRNRQVIGVLNFVVTVLGSEPTGCLIERERVNRTRIFCTERGDEDVPAEGNISNEKSEQNQTAAIQRCVKHAVF